MRDIFGQPIAVKKPTGVSRSPCDTCPLSPRVKVRPTIPPNPKVIVVGIAPGAEEEAERKPFVGPSGKMLRQALRKAGLDPVADVGYANLTRCRPQDDRFDTPDWERAETRCWSFLVSDVTRAAVPLILVGRLPTLRFLRVKGESSNSITISRARGLWHQAAPPEFKDRPVFAVKHPSGVLQQSDTTLKDMLLAEFVADIGNAVDVILNRVVSPIQATIMKFGTPEADAFLSMLPTHPGPWVFDIETFDAAQFPSRREVSTDPFHPDFRLRGIAFATSATEGVWIEDFPSWETRRDQVRARLDPVFGSDAAKWAFHGNFDDEGLIYPGWTTAIRNRTGDGMLAMVALSNGLHDSLTLERAVVDVLGERQYWVAVDKSRMRDLPVEIVGQGAVGDAAMTFKLCEYLHDRLARAEYLWTERQR